MARTIPATRPRSLEFAYLAHARLEFAGAARLFALAFRLEPRLADDLYAANRYNAACCAALAATGPAGRRGEPARQAALEWLRDDLAARSGVIRGGQEADRAQLRQALGHWKVEPGAGRSPYSRGPGRAPRARARRLAGPLGRGRFPHRLAENPLLTRPRRGRIRFFSQR